MEAAGADLWSRVKRTVFGAAADDYEQGLSVDPTVTDDAASLRPSRRSREMLRLTTTTDEDVASRVIAVKMLKAMPRVVVVSPETTVREIVDEIKARSDRLKEALERLDEEDAQPGNEYEAAATKTQQISVVDDVERTDKKRLAHKLRHSRTEIVDEELYGSGPIARGWDRLGGLVVVVRDDVDDEDDEDDEDLRMVDADVAKSERGRADERASSTYRSKRDRVMGRFPQTFLMLCEPDMTAGEVLRAGFAVRYVLTDDDEEQVRKDAQSEIDAPNPTHISDEESFIEANPFLVMGKRLLWLLMLLLVNVGTANILSSFEHVIDEETSLAFFIPLLIGTGGNAGAQMAMLVTAALSTKELTLAAWTPVLRLLGKEVGMGALLGLLLAVAAWPVAYWKGGGEVAWTVGTTMICLVWLADILGLVLPLLATLVNVNPAITTSPVITTVLDALGITIYFVIASIIVLD